MLSFFQHYTGLIDKVASSKCEYRDIISIQLEVKHQLVLNVHNSLTPVICLVTKIKKNCKCHIELIYL